MLKAFQTQLDALAADHDKVFEKHVIRRWGKPLPPGLLEELKKFVRLIPKIEKRIFALYVWLPETSKVKDLGSYFLTYMYETDDFLPQNEKTGLFGYLDDAYLAAYFYELMLEDIQATNEFRLRKEDTDLLRQLIRLRTKAEAIIPDEAIKIKQMIGELFEGEETVFQELFKRKIPA